MGRINHNENEVKLLAKLMMAEAIGELDQGMKMVGTVVCNRVEANCEDFKGLRTITRVIYQKIHGTNTPHFEPVKNRQLDKQHPKLDDIRRAKNLLNGHRDPKAKKSLWFHNPTPGRIVWVCPLKMPRSPKTMRYTKHKNHCFYVGVPGYCKEFYR